MTNDVTTGPYEGAEAAPGETRIPESAEWRSKRRQQKLCEDRRLAMEFHHSGVQLLVNFAFPDFDLFSVASRSSRSISASLFFGVSLRFSTCRTVSSYSRRAVRMPEPCA